MPQPSPSRCQRSCRTTAFHRRAAPRYSSTAAASATFRCVPLGHAHVLCLTAATHALCTLDSLRDIHDVTLHASHTLHDPRLGSRTGAYTEVGPFIRRDVQWGYNVVLLQHPGLYCSATFTVFYRTRLPNIMRCRLSTCPPCALHGVVARCVPCAQQRPECSTLHVQVGTSGRRLYCPRFCDEWLQACAGTFVAFHGPGGHLRWCSDSSATPTVCSRLDSVATSGEELCRLAGAVAWLLMRSMTASVFSFSVWGTQRRRSPVVALQRRQCACDWTLLHSLGPSDANTRQSDLQVRMLVMIACVVL